jgi:hypothetical protein
LQIPEVIIQRRGRSKGGRVAVSRAVIALDPVPPSPSTLIRATPSLQCSVCGLVSTFGNTAPEIAVFHAACVDRSRRGFRKIGVLSHACLGNGRSCAVAEPHASPEGYLAAAGFDSDAASKSPRSGQAEEKIKLDWLLAQDTPPTTSEANGTTVIAIFPSSTPQAVEEEIAKAHKLEFVRRLNTGSAEGRATLYRITDGRAAAEVVTFVSARRRRMFGTAWRRKHPCRRA